MKHLLFNFSARFVHLCVILFFSLSIGAHKINGYKFIHIQETGNLYGVEDKLTKYFTDLGFETVASYNIEEMNSSDKGQLLVATYVWNIVQGGHSTLILTLRDTLVYKVAGQGISMTAKGDMKNALKKIFKQMDNLHYTYNPDLIKVKVESKISFASWSEDSIKSYLRTKNTASIEGIYKNFSNNLDYYRIAILKEKDTYYGIIVETENKRWEKGDTKIVLHHIDKNNYDVDYYNFKGKKLNAIGQYDSRVLTFAYDDNGAKTEVPKSVWMSYSAFANTMGGTILLGVSEDLKEKDLAKRFRIEGVDDAERIRVVLCINGTPEEYNARILSVDKANDLALIAIKDNKFNSLPSAPYKIGPKVADVGTSVFTMGYPLSNVLGKEVKITDGIISSKTGYENDAVTYQISAPIQPGNSGGALFDKKGHLVGITNAGIPSAENVGYAIKSSYLLNLIDSAPITIDLPRGTDISQKDFTEVIKLYAPYVALIKIY